MAKSYFECKFHELKYFKVGYFLISWVHYNLENIIKIYIYIEEKNYVILLYPKQILDNHLFNPAYLHTICIVF